jgi:hypothetical protein
MRQGIFVAAAGLVIVVLALAADRGPVAARQEIDPADFQATITHPLFPLSLVGAKVFEGEEVDQETGEVIETRLESRLLDRTETVAGVTVVVLEEKAYEDGEIVEVALDYFAQHSDGSVYYFGEAVDNYEDGELKNHNGQWLAGESGNLPGVIMPAAPVVGETFSQEHAPGIAEDMATVLALGETVAVPAGTYEGCLKTKDFSPLEPGIEESKWYCPGVGMVKEEGDGSVNELVSVAAPAAAPAAVAPPATGDGGLLSDDGVGSAAEIIAAAVVLGLGLAGLRFRRGN